MNTTISGSTGFSEKVLLKKALLICGILSSLLYLAMNIFIPMQWKGYSVVTQVVSELSAIGAPTRPVWFAWGIVYTLLIFAFGVGIWLSAAGNRALRVVAGAFLVNGLIGLFWPPMQLRGSGEMTLTDILHIAFGVAWLLLSLLILSFSIAAFRGRFRLYTIVTLGLFVAFGILTGIESPNIAKNMPTPTIGIWERINIAVFMLWIAVLALVLLRTDFLPVQEDAKK